MKNIGIIRCEKNMDSCPMTNCIRCVREGKEAFAGYDDCRLVGIFTCHCYTDKTVDMCRILRKKGADVIHFVTCTFAGKSENGWALEGGLCTQIDEIIRTVNAQEGIPCVKGTAHLPKGYALQTWA